MLTNMASIHTNIDASDVNNLLKFIDFNYNLTVFEGRGSVKVWENVLLLNC